MKPADGFVLPAFKSATPYVVKVDASPAARAVLTLDVAGESREVQLDGRTTRQYAAQALQISESGVDALYIVDSGPQGWAALRDLSTRLADDLAGGRCGVLGDSVARIYACEDGAVLALGENISDEMLAMAYRCGADVVCWIGSVIFAERHSLLWSEVLRRPQRALDFPPLKSTVHVTFHEREAFLRAELQPLAEACLSRERVAERLGARRR